MKAKRNKSVRELVSFDNFDPTGPRDVLINSPRSLAVCEMFEIKPKELFMLTKKELLKAFEKGGSSPKERQALFQEYIHNMQNTLQDMYQKRAELIEQGAQGLQAGKPKKRKPAASLKTRSKAPASGPPALRSDAGAGPEQGPAAAPPQAQEEQPEDEQPAMNSKLLAENSRDRKASRRAEKRPKPGLAIGEQRPITAQPVLAGVATQDRKRKRPASLKRKLSLSTPQSLGGREPAYANFSSTVLPSGPSDRASQEPSTQSRLQQVEQREQKRQLTKLEAYRMLEEARQRLVQKLHLTNYRQKQHERQREGSGA